MKIRDLIAQLNASDAFAKDENPEVVVVDEDGETIYDLYEVIYNEHTDQLGILLFNRDTEPVTKDLPFGIEDEL